MSCNKQIGPQCVIYIIDSTAIEHHVICFRHPWLPSTVSWDNHTILDSALIPSNPAYIVL